MRDYWNKKKQQIINTPHKNKFYPGYSGRLLDGNMQRNTIFNTLKYNDIVVGSSAFNSLVKFPFPYRKQWTDVDVKSPSPRKRALSIERNLDNQANMDAFYVSTLTHDAGKTYRVHSRLGDKVVADIGKKDHNIPHKTHRGTNFETLGHRQQELEKMVANPSASYRREKDLKQLNRVKRYRQEIENRKQPYFDLNAVDTDGDGVPDYRDCAIWNPYKQGKFHDALKSGVGKIKKAYQERKESTEEFEEKKQSYKYIIIKINGKWQNLGAFSIDRLQQEIHEIQQNPDIEDLEVTDNPKLADKYNRELMVANVKTGAKRVGAGAVKVGAYLERRTEEWERNIAEAGKPRTPMVNIQVRTPRNFQQAPVDIPGRQRQATLNEYQSPVRDYATDKMGYPADHRGSFTDVVDSSPYQRPESPLDYMPEKEITYLTNAEWRELNRRGYSDDEIRSQGFERKYGYSHRSKNYREKSPFFNHAGGYETCVPYRPIGYHQVMLPHDPAIAPNKYGLKRAIHTPSDINAIHTPTNFKPTFVKPKFSSLSPMRRQTDEEIST